MTKRLAPQYCSHCPNTSEEQEAGDRAHTLSNSPGTHEWQKVAEAPRQLQVRIQTDRLPVHGAHGTFASWNSAGFQSLNSQLATPKSHRQSKTLQPGAGETLRDGGGEEVGGGGERDGRERGTHSPWGSGAPGRGDKGRDTVPRQRAAAFREPRGARSPRAGPVCRPLSSLQCQKEKRCRPRPRRPRRQRPRGARASGRGARLSSRPSLRCHPAGRCVGLGGCASSSVPPWGGGASRALPSRPPPSPDVGSQGGPTRNLVKKAQREGEREPSFPPCLSSFLLPLGWLSHFLSRFLSPQRLWLRGVQMEAA